MDNAVTLAGVIKDGPITSKVGKDDNAVSTRFVLGIHRVWNDRATKTTKEYTTYHDVVTYRSLAMNVAESCRAGDSVVVVGRLNSKESDKRHGATEIVADHVALNLTAGAIPLDD